VGQTHAASYYDFAIYAQRNVDIANGTVVGTAALPVLIGAGVDAAGIGDAILGANVTIHGNLRAGDDISKGTGTQVTGTCTNPDAFTGAGICNGGRIIAEPDLPDTLRAPASFSSSTNPLDDQSVGNGGTMNLAAGTYRDISLGANATLNLTAGDYYLRQLTSGSGLTINAALGGGNVNLWITTNFNAGGVAAMNLTGGTWENVYLEAHAASGNAFNIGANGGTNWKGTIVTTSTNADIHFGSGTNGVIEGYLWSARDVDLDGGLTMISPVPVPAAVWLMGSALGMLGWLRRQRR
jgi:hypothetical protein